MKKIKLPKYGSSLCCPKCGHPKTKDRYHKGALRYDCALPSYIYNLSIMGEEHLCRTCLHCDYRWAESCLDYKEERQ